MNSMYKDYLISAIDDLSAANFAADKQLSQDSWFRLPSSLDDATEAFIREETPVTDKDEWQTLTEDEVTERTLTGQWNSRILFAPDLHSAARYASKRNWWLHSWKFVQDAELEEVVEYAFFS